MNTISEAAVDALAAGYSKVLMADECPRCECCEEPICPVHGHLYADCTCIGPTEDDVDYLEIDGVMYGKRLKGASHEDSGQAEAVQD